MAFGDVSAAALQRQAAFDEVQRTRAACEPAAVPTHTQAMEQLFLGHTVVKLTAAVSNLAAPESQGCQVGSHRALWAALSLSIANLHVAGE